MTAVGMIWAAFAHAAAPGMAAEASTPALTLPTVEVQPSAKSQVPFVIGIEVAWAKAILEERVPTLLHQESNREVVSGVIIDVKVTRGAIEVQLGTDSILLRSPIEADINVRSRLGTYVVPLGSCKPIIDAEVATSLQVGSDGRLPRPTAKASLRTPCRLSGFDVTPFLQREIERQLTRGESQATKHLEQANRVVAELYGETMRRLASHHAGCLRLVPEQLLQGPLVEEHGMLVSRLIAEGTLSQQCEAALPPQMRVTQAREAAGLELVWQRRLTWSDLKALLLDRLGSAGIADANLGLRSARRGEKDEVAIFLRTESRSGWVFATPRIVDGSVRLTDVESNEAELLKTTRATILGLSVPVDQVAVEVLARQLVAESNGLTQVFGRSPDLRRNYEIRESDLQTRSEVRVDRDGLVVNVRRRQVALGAAN